MGYGSHSRDFEERMNENFPHGGYVGEIKLSCSCLKSCPVGQLKGQLDSQKRGSVWNE